MGGSTPTQTSVARANRRQKNISLVVRIVVGCTLLAALFWFIDIRSVINSFSLIYPVPVYALCIVMIIDRVLMAYKWNLLLRARRISLSLWEATRVYYISLLLGIYTPGGIGSEVYRVGALSRLDKTGPVISTILLERGIGLAVISVFAAIGLPVSLTYFTTSPKWLLWVIILMAILAVIGVWLSLNPRAVEGVVGQIPLLSKFRIMKRFREFYYTYAESRAHWRTLLVFTVLTAVEVVVGICAKYLGARSLGIDVWFGYFLCVMPLLTILIRLPITVGGIGVQEGLFAYFFFSAGFSAADGVSISLFLRVVGLFVTLVPACVMLWLGPWRLEPPNHTR